MGWHRQVVASPERLAEALAVLEPPERAVEAAQFEAAISVVEALAPTVSRRESMLVTLTGHTDPAGEGFDSRNVSVTISRVNAEAAKEIEERKLEEERLIREAQDAADRQAERAREAEQDLAEAAASEEPPAPADA